MFSFNDFYGCNGSSDPHFSTLGIAGDVIDCSIPRTKSGSNLWNYSAVNITEVASDKLNDNPKGLPMDVFSVNAKEIVYHNYSDVHTDFQLTLSRTGINRFIIPPNYFNRPWYMRTNSTISLEIALKYTQKPKIAYVCILKGEAAIKTFLNNHTFVPKPEYKQDLFEMMDHKSNTVEIRDNGYYYVAIHITGKKGTMFYSNTTFNFLYIDIKDYDINNAEQVDGIGESVVYPINASENKITLCYIHPLKPNQLASPSIHLNIEYVNSNLTVFIPYLINPLTLLLIAYHLLLIAYCTSKVCC